MPSRPAVLLVEDDASVRTTLSAALTLVGFRVYQADRLDMALELLGTEHIDAIVLDVHIPDSTGARRSGLELLAFIRASGDLAELPAMIFTGQELSRAEALVARTHGARVFYKPQGTAELIDHLATVVQTAAG
jgi:DNA-binding response OmpR family regulator